MKIAPKEGLECKSLNDAFALAVSVYFVLFVAIAAILGITFSFYEKGLFWIICFVGIFTVMIQVIMAQIRLFFLWILFWCIKDEECLSCDEFILDYCYLLLAKSS